jgi:hypothetical protein
MKKTFKLIFTPFEATNFPSTIRSHLKCLNHIGSLTQQRVGEKRRINVVDGNPDRIAVHGSNEFQRDRPGPSKEQCEDKSCSFLPRDMHLQTYSELHFDICKREVLRRFASLRCSSRLKDCSTASLGSICRYEYFTGEKQKHMFVDIWASLYCGSWLFNFSVRNRAGCVHTAMLSAS